MTESLCAQRRPCAPEQDPAQPEYVLRKKEDERTQPDRPCIFYLCLSTSYILFSYKLLSLLLSSYGGKWLSRVYTYQMLSYGEAAWQSTPKAVPHSPEQGWIDLASGKHPHLVASAVTGRQGCEGQMRPPGTHLTWDRGLGVHTGVKEKLL